MALVITIAGVNRTTVTREDSIRISQLADSYVFTAELTIFDVDGDISITAGSHKVADEITIVDGATTFFGGYVANEDITAAEDGSRHISLQCQGYSILLAETLVEFEEYAATSDALVIDDLFTTYLAAVDSTTHVATIDASMDISFSEMNLAEIMDALCQRTQGRWYVDNTKNLHYFAAEGNDAGFDLSDTPNDVTSFSYYTETERRENAAQIVNRVRVIGADDFAVVRNDATSQTAYGIRAALVVDTSLTTTAEMEERGDEILAANKDPKVTFVVRTPHDGAVAGNEIDYKDTILGYNSISNGDDKLVIRELNVYWEQGEPVYEMTLGEAETLALQRATFTSSEIRAIVVSPSIPLASRGWGHDLVFSATDHDTVAWALGTITLAGGTGSYSIDAGNTGNMGAVTYVYLDTATSSTVLQTDTDNANSVGANKILVGVAHPRAAGLKATYLVFGGEGHNVLVDTENIAAAAIELAKIADGAVDTEKLANLAVELAKIADGAVDTDKIAANAVTATKILADTITANEIAANTITAAEILANTITATEILGNTITAVEIAAGTITTTEILANTILAGDIAANTITANEILGNTITAAEIAATTITAAEIAAATITGAKIAANTITAEKISIGQSIFDAANGLLLLGPYCELNTTEWWTLRRQKATLSGTLHQTTGRWLGTKALVVERAKTNLITNPSGETATTSWTTGHGAVSRTTSYSVVGSYAFTYLSDTQYGDVHYIYSAAASTAYAFSLWVKTTSSAVHVRMWDDVANAYISPLTYCKGDNQWHRYIVTGTMGGGAGNMELRIQDDRAAGWDTIYFDGAQLETGGYGTTYLDGSLGEGYTWSGTAHASTSTRAITTVNIAALVGSITGNDTSSFCIWAQMPYDSDGTWPEAEHFLFGASGAVNHNIYLEYYPATDVFIANINGAWRITTAAQSFKKGDWLHFVLTVDFASNSYVLYIDGVSAGSDTTALAAPTLTAWNVGILPSAAGNGDFIFAEYAVFDRVLTSAEAAQLFNLQRPMVDMGSTEVPGVYILDGKFHLASSVTGSRVELTADEIATYHGADKINEIDSDGIGVLISTAYSDIRSFHFRGSTGTVHSRVAGLLTATDNKIEVATRTADINGEVEIRGKSNSGYSATVDILAQSGAILAGIDVVVTSGGTGTVTLSAHSAGQLQVGNGYVMVYNNIQGNTDLVFETGASGTYAFRPDYAAGSGYLGTSTYYWNVINYKTLTDRGCLIDLGTEIEMQDGKKLSPVAALGAIRVSDVVSPRTGLKQLDYTTFPKLCFSEGEYAQEDILEDGKLKWVKGEKTGADGVEIGTLVSIMMGAIQELSGKIEKLEVKCLGV